MVFRHYYDEIGLVIKVYAVPVGAAASVASVDTVESVASVAFGVGSVKAEESAGISADPLRKVGSTNVWDVPSEA